MNLQLVGNILDDDEEEELKDETGDSDDPIHLMYAEDIETLTLRHDSVSPRVLAKLNPLPSNWNEMKEKLDPKVWFRIRHYHPVFSYDGDGCFPAAAVSSFGIANTGLDSSAGCRQSDFFSHSNTYHRWGRFLQREGVEYEVHMYALYFEVDASPTFGIGTHRHDWEAVVVTFRNGNPYRVSVSAHGKWIQKWWGDVPKHFNHPKIVYHKERELGLVEITSSFRFGKKSTEKCHSVLRGTPACWGMPSLVSWEYMRGSGVTNQRLKDILNTQGKFGKAKPQFTDKHPTFQTYVQRTGVNVNVS